MLIRLPALVAVVIVAWAMPGTSPSRHVAADGTTRAAPPDDRAVGRDGPAPAAQIRRQRATARERAAARRAQREAARHGQQTKRSEAWLARLEARGVEPWPEESDDDHAQALDRSRTMVDDVIALFPGTALYDTEHFLFVSNIPPSQIGP